MGALPFAEFPALPDALRPGVTHGLRVFEQGGEIFIRIELAPPTGADAAYTKDRKPYTATIMASLRVTPQQLEAIEQGMADARRRIGA